MRKKCLVLLLLATTLVSSIFAGCGKKKTAADSTETSVDDGFMYVPKIDTITAGSGEEIGAMQLTDGKLIYPVYTYDDDYNIKSLKLHVQDRNGGNESETEIENIFNDDKYAQNFGFVGDTIEAMVVTFKEEKTEYALAKFDKSGKFVSDVTLKNLDDSGYLRCAGIDRDGFAYIMNDEYAFKVSSEGEVISSVRLPENVMNPFMDNDGNFYVTSYGKGYEITGVDFDKKSLTEKWENVPTDADSIFDIGDGRFLIFTQDAIFEYEKEAGEATEIVKYIDMDMPTANPFAAWKNEDGTYTYIYQDWMGGKDNPDRVTLEKVEKTGEEKTKIYFATGYANEELKNAIRTFNRTSQEYRIEMTEYMNRETWEFDIDRFNADMSSGKVDVVAVRDLYDSFKPENYIDLKTYIDNDADISLSDYFENVFKACEQKGKLYTLPTSFTVSGFGANTDFVGKDEKFTFDRFLELIKNSNGKKILPEYIAPAFISECIAFAGNRFVDYENAKCDLNNDDFIALLDYAKNLPLSYDDDPAFMDFDFYGSMQKGETVLFNLSVYDAMEVQIINKVLGDKLNPVGYPGENGGQFAFNIAENYAIPVNSNNKDGAWAFLKTLLQDQYQGGDYLNGFPVKKKFYEQKIDNLMNGKSTYGGGAVTSGNTTIEVGAPTKEDVLMLKDIIDRANIVMNKDNGLMDIINEELTDYKKGGKSAAEVAEIMQNRVSIYLSEKYE